MTRKSKAEKRAGIFASVFLAAAVIMSLCVVIQVYASGYVSFFGYSLFRVVTGSMEPEIETGAILVCRGCSVEAVSEGDIICYVTDVTEIKGSVVTHRVVSVNTDENGEKYFVTKGDANTAVDSYYVTDDNLIGRVIWHSDGGNLMTDLLSFLSSNLGFITCILLPLIMICAWVMRHSVKGLKKAMDEVAEEELKKDEGTKPLEGYETLTEADYERIKAQVIKEMEEEAFLKAHEKADGGDSEKASQPET